ncbi:UNVERIFIED_CONTAM: phage gp6-like head-tail connector protein [Xanthomonas axonopodis]
MPLVTLEEARAHCRADSEDALQMYLDAAVDAAERFLNRRIFGTPSELAAAISLVPAELGAAQVRHDDDLAAAELLDGVARCVAERAVENDLRAAVHAAGIVYRGVVATSSINSAVLLITGHLYRNREAVVSEPASQLPLGAHELLWPYRVDLGV